jgi:hypothetical protein
MEKLGLRADGQLNEPCGSHHRPHPPPVFHIQLAFTSVGYQSIYHSLANNHPHPQ